MVCCLSFLASAMAFREKQFSSTPGTPKVLVTQPTCKETNFEFLSTWNGRGRGGGEFQAPKISMTYRVSKTAFMGPEHSFMTLDTLLWGLNTLLWGLNTLL